MSRRRNDDFDDVMAVLGCLFMLFLPFIWLYDWLKPSLESKLHKLDDVRPQIWGKAVGELRCHRCESINEEYRRSCFNCGANLRVHENKSQVIDEAKKRRDKIILWVIVLIQLSIMIYMFFLFLEYEVFPYINRHFN